MSPRTVAAQALGLLCLLAVGLLAVAPAAPLPSGLLLGAPSAWGTLLVAVLVLGGAFAAPPERRALGLGLLPFLVAPWLAAWVPGLAAWTGPPLWAPFIAALLLMPGGWRAGTLARKALLPGLFAVYAVAAWRVQVQVGPEGDEPHYLMVADSLLRDGDLSLEQDYAERRYVSFYQKGDLAPHYRVRGKSGQIYSLHAIGLSLLALPAYALGGYPAVSYFIAFLLACLVRETRRLLDDWLGDPDRAAAAAWLVGLSPPLIHYAGLVFTEVPAALFLTLALRLGANPTGRRARLAWLAAAIAFLPWLNVRYAPLAAVALLHALLRRPTVRAGTALLAAAAASTAALALHHHALYGFYDPSRVYGPRPELAAGQLGEGLPGLLLDQEFGLLAYAPVFAIAAPGLVAFTRRRPLAGAVALGLVLATTLVSGSWHMWRGGFNPPGRFLLPIVPVLALGIGQATRRGRTFGPSLLAGWGLWVGLAGAWEPRLVHRDRDGSAPFFRAAAGAEEWTRLLPGYVLGDPDRKALALVWAVALASAAAGSLRRRPPSVPSVAAASVASLLAAAAASAVAVRTTGGREAVHLVGRPALELPALRAVASAQAVWGPEDLAWGPTYEPHRHPAGAPVGDRLDLPPGTYRLEARAERLGAEAPVLVLGFEGGRGAARRRPTRWNERGLEVDFEVPDGAGPVTMRMHQGSPFNLRELRLERSTFPRAPGLIR